MINGKIDQRKRVLQMGEDRTGQSVSRYRALERWTEQIDALAKTIPNKVNWYWHYSFLLPTYVRNKVLLTAIVCYSMLSHYVINKNIIITHSVFLNEKVCFSLNFWEVAYCCRKKSFRIPVCFQRTFLKVLVVNGDQGFKRSSNGVVGFGQTTRRNRCEIVWTSISC